MALDPNAKAPRSKISLTSSPILNSELNECDRGKHEAKRREHASSGRRYASYVSRKLMVTAVGCELHYLGNDRVRDQANRAKRLS